MTTLKWNAAKVIELARKTQSAPAHSPDFEGDNAPSLLFVKDEGIYLMSNRVYTEGETPLNTHEVLYAEGFNADADWDKVCDAVGGDDFSETIHVDSILGLCKRAIELIDQGVITPKGYKFFISMNADEGTMTYGFKLYKK